MSAWLADEANPFAVLLALPFVLLPWMWAWC